MNLQTGKPLANLYFSVSCLQLILPPSIPTTKSDSSSDSNSVKSCNDDVAPPIVPVLPFFSLPVTTPILKATIPPKQDRAVDVCRNNGYQDGGLFRKTGYQDGGIGRNSNGYQRSGGIFHNNGYQDCRIGFISGYHRNDVASGKIGGYQDSGLSCASVDSGCRQGNDAVVIVNRTMYDDVKANLPDKVVGDKCDDDAPTLEITTINCCVGEQQQLMNENDNLHQLAGHPPSDDHKKETPVESVVCVENHREQVSQFFTI